MFLLSYIHEKRTKFRLIIKKREIKFPWILSSNNFRFFYFFSFSSFASFITDRSKFVFPSLCRLSNRNQRISIVPQKNFIIPRVRERAEDYFHSRFFFFFFFFSVSKVLFKRIFSLRARDYSLSLPTGSILAEINRAELYGNQSFTTINFDD